MIKLRIRRKDLGELGLEKEHRQDCVCEMIKAKRVDSVNVNFKKVNKMH